jgi:hypothetical protein
MIHPVDAFVDFIVVGTCLIIIAANATMVWLMVKSLERRRAWCASIFFALIVAQALDYLISYLNVDHQDISETWHMRTLRVLFAIASVALAGLFYRDNGIGSHETAPADQTLR